MFETRGLVGKNKEDPLNVSNELFFEAGVVRAGKFYPKGQSEGEPLVKVDYQVESGGIFKNFIDRVRSRKAEHLNADILEGHYSSGLCHLGNISYRMGRPAPFGPPSGLSDSSVVSDSVMTLLENTKAIGVDPARTTLWTGPKLEFNAEAEQFPR